MNALRASTATLSIADWKDCERCVVSVRRQAWRWPAVLAIRTGAANASVAAAHSSHVRVLEPGSYVVMDDATDALDRRVRRLEALSHRRLATSRLGVGGAHIAADRAQLATLDPGARAVPAPVALAALGEWLLPRRAIEIQYQDGTQQLTCRASAGRLAASARRATARDRVVVIAPGVTHTGSAITIRRVDASIAPQAGAVHAVRALARLAPRELLAFGGALGAFAPGSFPEVPRSTRAWLGYWPLPASLVLLAASGSYWLDSARALDRARAQARELQTRIDSHMARR